MLNYTIYKAIMLPNPKYCLKSVKTTFLSFKALPTKIAKKYYG